jgi:hypothetical protein
MQNVGMAAAGSALVVIVLIVLAVRGRISLGRELKGTAEEMRRQERDDAR